MYSIVQSRPSCSHCANRQHVQEWMKTLCETLKEILSQRLVVVKVGLGGGQGVVRPN